VSAAPDERVRAIISAWSGSKLPILNGETLFDLDIAGTMDRAALAADIEDAFGIVIGDDDVALWRTVADVLAFVARCAAAGSIADPAERLPTVTIEAEKGMPALAIGADNKDAPDAAEFLAMRYAKAIRAGEPGHTIAEVVALLDHAEAMRLWYQERHGHVLSRPRSIFFEEAKNIVAELARREEGAATPRPAP
jgi:acyl carrier protein